MEYWISLMKPKEQRFSINGGLIKSERREYLDSVLRTTISLVIRKKIRGNPSIFSLVGFTRGHLLRHIESQFKPGMAFDNYGAWHVDHIRRLNELFYKDENDRDFKVAWGLDNLRPLWAIENLKRPRLY
jgi:hypothetical protein